MEFIESLGRKNFFVKIVNLNWNVTKNIYSTMSKNIYGSQIVIECGEDDFESDKKGIKLF